MLWLCVVVTNTYTDAEGATKTAVTKSETVEVQSIIPMGKLASTVLPGNPFGFMMPIFLWPIYMFINFGQKLLTFLYGRI